MKVVIRRAALAMVFVGAAACAPAMSTARTETVVSMDGQQASSQTLTIDGVPIETIRREWENQWVEATGSAPYIDKYPGQAIRNRALAREAALALAQRGLIEQVAAVQVTASTRVVDLMATSIVDTRIRGAVQNAEIISEGWVRDNEAYEIKMRMPKAVLLRIIEETRR